VHAERTVRIVNPEGLHARPCHALASMANEYRACELRVSCNGIEVDGRGIMTLMTLGAVQGDLLHLSARGERAADLVDRLAALVESGFEERS